MIIPMLCVTIFVILVVWFLLPRVARLMIHTPTAISIFVCLSMVDRKSGSAGMPRPTSYAVFCLKKKTYSPVCTEEQNALFTFTAHAPWLNALPFWTDHRA